MRRGGAVALGGILILLFLNEVYLVRAARRIGAPRIELGRCKVSRLQEGTREVLSALRDDVFITYYASDRARMPSGMRRVERQVMDLLAALRAASTGRIAYQLVDPEVDPDLARYAARRGIAPFRSRSVERDSYSERTVWSALTLAYGPRAEVSIPGIGPEHVPRLQGLIAEHLRQLEAAPAGPAPGKAAGRKPTVGLCAPADTRDLQETIAERALVARVDLTSGGAIPPEIDVLFWIDPGAVGPSILREVQAFIDRGRSVVIAGSATIASIEEADGKPALRVRPGGSLDEALLAHFGLKALQGIVLDKSSGEIAGKDGTLPAPFLLRCNGYNQNFRGLRGQPNGNLLFFAPTPLVLDGETLAERGWSAQVLAASSEATSFLPLPDRSVPIEGLTPGSGEPAPKLALAVLLRPSDPWKGSVVVCAASTPFRDERFREPGTAHPRLAQALLDNLATPERLVLNRAGTIRPEPLPELSWAARLFWRSACVFIFPAFLAILAFARGVFRGAPERVPRRRRERRGLLLRGAAGLAAALAAARLAGLAGLRADLTKDGLNELAPQTRVIARSLGSEPVRAEIFFSPRDRLPPAMRPLVKRLRGALGEIRRAGARLEVSSTTPEDLAPEERSRLEREGIGPVKVTTRDEELTTVRTVYGALRLGAAGRSEVLRFAGPASFENLEFRLAFALWRLRTGRRPHIGFASDTPRLSPAEAHEYYQTQGLLAPLGTDVYSLARELLEGCDFRVTHVNSREPAPPADLDLLVCLQPRRPVEKLFTEISRRLHEGGKVLLAAQHFNVQARQYRGTSFKFVYWPQPQACDMERYYFPEIGIDLVREVLFDELKTAIAMDAQINRYLRPEFERQESALPFLIRASSANYASGSTVTAGLGDQAFIWGSFIRWNEEKLRPHRIRAIPLATTSARSWTFVWKGGWIPDPLLVGPVPSMEGSSPGFLGKLPLAALFEGEFPFREIQRDEGAKPEPGKEAGNAPPGAAEAPAAPPGPPKGGKLLLIGCSEMFKSHRLLDPSFRADHLLLNAAATLALDPDLAAVACRRPVPRGFDYIEPDRRILWRILVIAAGPAAMVALGFLRRLLLRPGSPRGASAGKKG